MDLEMVPFLGGKKEYSIRKRVQESYRMIDIVKLKVLARIRRDFNKYFV
jgi:hypothetical protein